ncbi:hypothetical protein BRW62_08850 [Parathermosynechococcus lividus PCC 6715]|uniref:Uncharacterized protein n=1 Tax=Parathermosynechococcus lividus PCC 6715 TaxID=1917166 RepID=A0A2D2Q2V5_PARLV|nr:proline-rich domain-containing protein [Thermostichus lividus]ATS18834.1 hypothetical protein BRW62_08850 [Thermostichus lividus PCC 6715]
MGDRELIEQFVTDLLQKNSRMLSNRHLRVELTFDEVQLISYKDGMVARVKTDAPNLAIEVRDASPFRPLLEEVMVGHNIFQVGISKSAGFLRYEPRTIPEGYLVQYTEGGVLWKDRWARGKRRSALSGGGNSLGMDAMILYRGTWYPIQSVNAANGFISVRTLGGEATYSASDFVVWLKKEKSESEETPSQITAYKIGERLPDVDSAPTRILETTEIAAPATPTVEENTVLQPTPAAAADTDDYSIIAPPPVPAVAATTSAPPVAPQGYPQQSYEQSVGYPHPGYEYSQGYPQQSYEQSVGYPHPGYEYSQGYPQQSYEQSVGYPHPSYEYSQGYPQQGYEQSVGYPHPHYAANYPPQAYQHIDPNIQMALTYLQSSLAYLLQVEPKSPHIHAAIRATSMAIQNLLSILNH